MLKTNLPHSVFAVLMTVCLLLVGAGDDVTAAEFGGSLAPPISHTSIGAFHRSSSRITELLEIKKLRFGAPVFFRVFKAENELELWLEDGEQFRLYKTYVICYRSGTLGPKTKEGDRQSPEGFYLVGYGQMNPWSRHHLAFNLGYPNEFDLHYGRTGSGLMVHGRCSSDGCFAMTDYYMDEIYTLAHEALSQSQTAFQVHVFPFRMTAENMSRFRDAQWQAFWQNLKEGYDYFETHKHPPDVSVSNGRYQVAPPPEKQNVAQIPSSPSHAP